MMKLNEREDMFRGWTAARGKEKSKKMMKT